MLYVRVIRWWSHKDVAPTELWHWRCSALDRERDDSKASWRRNGRSTRTHPQTIQDLHTQCSQWKPKAHLLNCTSVQNWYYTFVPSLHRSSVYHVHWPEYILHLCQTSNVTCFMFTMYICPKFTLYICSEFLEPSGLQSHKKINLKSK